MHRKAKRPSRRVAAQPTPEATAPAPEAATQARKGTARARKGAGAISETLTPTSETAAQTRKGAAPPAKRAKPRQNRRLPWGDKYSTTDSMEQRAYTARMALLFMLESERQRTLLANYGYSAERLKEGLALHHHAWELFIDQSSQYGASIAAINRHHAAQASARSIFAQHRAIAQVALRGERALAQALGLGEQCPRAQTAWQHYAEQFYANALNDEAILAHLTAYGVNAEQIAVGQRQLAAVVDTLRARQQQHTRAVAATRARNQAFVALDAWMRDFQTIVSLIPR